MRWMVLILIDGMLMGTPVAFRNISPGVRYIGSRSCMPCHKAIYDTYMRTPMGRSLTRPSPQLVAGTIHINNERFAREFELQSVDGEILLTESQQKAGKTIFRRTYPLEFAIGSGVNGISFAVRRGKYLFQAPVSYYSAAGRWDLSPGFDQTGEGFNRPIYGQCIVCHAGRSQAVPGRDGMYGDPPFTELAVGCENCHGPGQLHVAERSAGRAQRPDTSIVNPRRLQVRLAEDICMLCHQGGDARVLLPGRNYTDFRPGTPLIKTVAIVGLLEGKDADLLEHHASMKLSACYRRSNGRLSCMSCHNPHEKPAANEAPLYFRARCLKCHNEQSCGLDLEARQKTSPPDNCVGCHMPKRSDSRISHSALTNHRIPAHTEARPGRVVNADAGSAEMPGLWMFNEMSEENKRLPLVTRLAAYGELLGRSPSLESKYSELLTEAARSQGDDPLVLAALGHRALNESRVDAVSLLIKAEQEGALSAVNYLDLGAALAQAGRLEESIGALERGERLFPFSPALRKHLVLSYIRGKAYEKARTALERYVEDFPEDDFMRGLLEQASSGARP